MARYKDCTECGGPYKKATILNSKKKKAYKKCTKCKGIGRTKICSNGHSRRRSKRSKLNKNW